MKYKAIFFDRDGTLTYFNPEKETWRDHAISNWSDKKFQFDYEKMMKLFYLASEGKTPWYKNIEDEKEFFKRYYYHMLKKEGITEDLKEKSETLFKELWCNNDRLLFSDVIETLEYFKSRNYKMGVISDTSPSLKYSLEQLGISKYFTSFTASSLVGASKPSPIIFNVALKTQGVTSTESIYVDDYDTEADGARYQGFTSFLIDRKSKTRHKWVIKSLLELIEFEKNL